MSEHALQREVNAARILRAALLEVIDDPDAIADTIEGSTNLHEAIAAVVAGISEDEMMCTGLGVMMETLSRRKSRFEGRIERRRTAIERAMMAAELHTLQLPEVTLSLRRVPQSLQVVNEQLIPESFFTPGPPKLDRKLLKASLEAGQEIHGARLSNGGQTLSMRRA